MQAVDRKIAQGSRDGKAGLDQAIQALEGNPGPDATDRMDLIRELGVSAEQLAREAVTDALTFQLGVVQAALRVGRDGPGADALVKSDDAIGWEALVINPPEGLFS